MSTLFRKVKAVSDFQETKSPADNLMLLKRALKLTEESGEIAAEVLKLVDYKSTDETPKQIVEHLKEEAVDALITALDIINHLKMSEEEVVFVMESKLDKWKNKHIEKNNKSQVKSDSKVKIPEEWKSSKQKKKKSKI